LHSASVLEQERAAPPTEVAGDPLDAHEARRSIGPCRLQELDDAVTGDVTGEALLDVNPGQDRAFGRLVIGRRLVFVHGDDRVRAGPPGVFAHVTTSLFPVPPPRPAAGARGQVPAGSP
jgi:hypothetical protein